MAPREVPPIRQRVYEAAMAEYERAGVENARVEDIVAAAGVSWGTFFHYFPTQGDVLLQAPAIVCRAYAEAAAAGLSARRTTEDVLWDAFVAMFAAAVAVTGSRALRGAMVRPVLSSPGVLTACLGDEVLPPVRVTEQVIAAGQRSGEVRAGEPAGALGVIVLNAVLFSAQRGAAIGRPEGSSPLGRLALEITLRGMRPDGGQPRQAAAQGRPDLP
jgi:AcrR family transcriptional regulator